MAVSPLPGHALAVMLACRLADMKAITVRVEDDLHHQARVISVERGEPLQRVLADLLRKWVEHYGKEKG